MPYSVQPTGDTLEVLIAPPGSISYLHNYVSTLDPLTIIAKDHYPSLSLRNPHHEEEIQPGSRR